MEPTAPGKARRRKKVLLYLAIIALLGAAAMRIFSPALNGNYIYSSRYITMRDGVRIAVDLYLPKNIQSDEHIPTILLQSRYNRGNRLRWPFGYFWSDTYEHIVRFFVAHHYAYVIVDVRGAGASFGTRAQEWSPEEIRDGAQIVDWIIAQSWSNQKVGSTGASYDGAASEFLASNRHPAVKAVMPVFSIFDAYTDMAYPGGVELDRFLAMWSGATQAIDRNTFGQKFLTGIARFSYKGVRPVQDDPGEKLLQSAFREHVSNYDLMATLQGKSFRDDGTHVADMSPYTRRAETEASGTAIYSFDGWYDAAMPHAAVKRFLNIKTPGSRLVLGPWNHAFKAASPFPGEDGREFYLNEALRFFDFYLKGVDNGLAQEKPVRYYTVGENKWKSSDAWPPSSTPTIYYLGANHSLNVTSYKGGNSAANSNVNSDADSDAYTVDLAAATGNRTRWNSLFVLDRAPGPHALRDDADKKLFVYTSPALATDLEVTGHPIFTLFADANSTDANFFVYLEDVDEQGHVRYVTEGLLRAMHRKISTSAPLYADVGTDVTGIPKSSIVPSAEAVPYHSYTHSDAQPLVAGEIAELKFDLQPISYLFRRGHSVRVAISCADQDHFATPPNAATVVNFHRDAVHGSSIMLPVIPRPAP